MRKRGTLGASGRGTTEFPPHGGCALYIRRLCIEDTKTDLGRSAVCPGQGIRAEESFLTAPQKSAEGMVPQRLVGRSERSRGVVASGGVATDGIRQGVGQQGRRLG